jgi:hypoxanthine phosphoribosyltransferase
MPAATPPPEHLRDEVESVLIGETEIAARVRELAAEIERDFVERDLLVVALLTGTVPFLADLIRHITLPMRLDFMGVSSYGNNTAPGELVFTKELRLEARNRDVLLVDDILDTGKTLRAVIDKLNALEPKSLKTCVLLEKKSRRAEEITADYVGFDVPDAFVVGYGLDYAERYRNLPFIGILKPEVYA